MKLNTIALANTFAVIDVVLHSLFRVWAFLSPDSYVWAMHLFVEGLQLNIDPSFDLNVSNFTIGTVLEAATFWILGFCIALLYNRFSR